MSGIVGSLNTRGSGLINIGSATDGQVFTGTGAGLPVGFEAAAGGGKVLQTIWYNTTTVTSGTTAWGWDDTLPQISEGTEILTQAFTPASATSNIFIQAKINFGLSVNARLVGALFVSESDDALTMTYENEENTEMSFLYLQWFIASGDTDARTYSVRVGLSGTSYSFRVNTGGEATHRFAASNNSNMLITEYEAN